MFDTQLILDADYGDDGWEVSVRFDAESQEVGWSDMDDAALKLAVGEGIAQVLIDARNFNALPVEHVTFTEAEFPGNYVGHDGYVVGRVTETEDGILVRADDTGGAYAKIQTENIKERKPHV